MGWAGGSESRLHDGPDGRISYILTLGNQGSFPWAGSLRGARRRSRLLIVEDEGDGARVPDTFSPQNPRAWEWVDAGTLLGGNVTCTSLLAVPKPKNPDINFQVTFGPVDPADRAERHSWRPVDCVDSDRSSAGIRL